MAWDSNFKNMLKQLLGNAGISVITETEVATSNQRIDFVILKNNQTMNTPFKYAKQVIIGEFKSEKDKLLDGDLLMLLSKAFNYIATTHGYGNKKSDLKPIDIFNVSCIMFLGGRKSTHSLKSLHLKINKIANGVYEINYQPIHILILEIDNIELSPEFMGLKIFATRNIREKTLKEAIQNDNNFIKSVAYFLYKEELISLANAEGKPISPVSLSIKSAVETIGIKSVIEEVGLSRVIEEIGLSRVIEEVGLEQLVKSLSEDDKVSLRKLLEES